MCVCVCARSCACACVVSLFILCVTARRLRVTDGRTDGWMNGRMNDNGWLLPSRSARCVALRQSMSGVVAVLGSGIRRTGVYNEWECVNLRFVPTDICVSSRQFKWKNDDVASPRWEAKTKRRTLSPTLTVVIVVGLTPWLSRISHYYHEKIQKIQILIWLF